MIHFILEPKKHIDLRLMKLFREESRNFYN